MSFAFCMDDEELHLILQLDQPKKVADGHS